MAKNFVKSVFYAVSICVVTIAALPSESFGQTNCPPSGLVALQSITNITGTSFQINWTSTMTFANNNPPLFRYSFFVNGAEFAVAHRGNGAFSDVFTFPGGIPLIPGFAYPVVVAARVNCADPNSGDQIVTDVVSNAITFIALPGKPVLNDCIGASPACSSSASTSEITFSWVTLFCEGYFFDLNTTSDFQQTQYVEQNTLINNPAPPLPATLTHTTIGLAPGTNYYYQLRSYNNYNGFRVSEYSERSAAIPTRPAVPVANAVINTDITSTSFKATWATSGNGNATKYKVEVANSAAFTPPLTAVYDNIDYTITSQVVTGLSPGSQYYYRVTALTSTGSTVTTPVSVKTKAVAKPATIQTTNSFRANWEAGSGVTSYRLDVSINSGFTVGSFVTGFNGLVVNGQATISQNVDGLAPGTVYYYRVRSVNADGTSTNSDPILAMTTPVATNETIVTSSSFKANWNMCSGSDGQHFDLSPQSTFLSFVTGYNNLLVSQATNFHELPAGSLSSGSPYYYRVRSVKTFGGTTYFSEYSNPILVVTTPTALAPDNIQTNAFVARWDGGDGADHFRLDVSSENTFTTGMLPQYTDKQVAGASHAITGLQPGTNYFYRVRAAKNPETSASSLPVGVITLPASPLAIGVDLTTLTEHTFVARWNSVTGADNYRLDVSANDTFTEILQEYEGLLVTSTSHAIVGLAAGTRYYYRVRAENSSGLSDNSGAIDIRTIPAAPVSQEAVAQTTSSFTAVWQPVQGADEYRLDVARDVLFNDVLPEFNGLVVSTAQREVTGLLPGAVYYYRVRAANTSGVSGTSGVKTTKTISLPPEIKVVANVAANSFRINWEPSNGVESYRLDVATDQNFTEVLPAYNDLDIPLSNASWDVSGLTPGTNYYYRLRTKNSAGTSSSSAAIVQLTLPAVPHGLNAPTAEITADKIRVFWTGVKSAVSYDLQISLSQNFDPIQHEFTGILLTERIIEGLSPSKIYFIRVRARNESGLSETFSETITRSTLAGDGTNPILLVIVTEPERETQRGVNEDLKISAGFDGGLNTQVHFHHRKRSERNFTTEVVTPKSITPEEQVYEVSVQPTWLDHWGMEYFFTAQDETSQVKESRHGFTALKSDVKIPLQSYGKELSNYHIISFPVQPPESQIRDLFTSAMGDYDVRRWRFFKYVNEENIEFTEGVSLDRIKQGEAYWFITALDKQLEFEEPGVAYDNSVDKPFKLRLEKGWNLIGNPFPYDLSWNSILNEELNKSKADLVSELFTFGPDGQGHVGFTPVDRLKTYGGGFVLAEESVEIQFNVTLAEAVGGKTKNEKDTSPEQVHDGWVLPITLVQGEVINSSAGFGMTADAKDTKDPLDRPTPPRFIRYVEFNTNVDAFAYPLSRDIVAIKEKNEWNFEIKSNSSEAVVLQWDQSAARELNAELTLFDHTNRTLVNMRSVGEYTSSPSAKITIYYGEHLFNEGQSLLKLNKPYPNPFQSEVIIPFDYSSGELYPVSLEITDVMGRIIRTETVLPRENLMSVTWDGRDEKGSLISPGVYMYKITPPPDKTGIHFVTGRLVKN